MHRRARVRKIDDPIRAMLVGQIQCLKIFSLGEELLWAPTAQNTPPAERGLSSIRPGIDDRCFSWIGLVNSLYDPTRGTRKKGLKTCKPHPNRLPFFNEH